MKTIRKSRLSGIAAVVMAMSFFSCEDHQEIVQFRELAVTPGSILCSDGRAVSYDDYRDDMDGVAVIVRTGTADDDYRFIAIGMKDIGSYPYVRKDGDDIEEFFDNGAGTDVNAFDGKENTAAMISQEYVKEKKVTGQDSEGNGFSYSVYETLSFPAADAASAYMSGKMQGWHLPSCGEWLAVFTQRETVMRSLRLIGGDWVDEQGWYQSSTQDGASKETVSYYNLMVSPSGTSKGTMKTQDGPVRPFITIK